MAVVNLSNGIDISVDIEEVQENLPIEPAGLDFLPDITGTVVVYCKVPGLVEISLLGRVKSKDDAEDLMLLIGQDITLTERDGSVSNGWTMRTEPAPTAQRLDGDSPDYRVSMRLWRLP
jgi:hypothetical protein